MGFFDFFSKPENIEQKGDAFFSSEAFGPAKLEYEKALSRHQKKQAADPDFQKRIQEKIQQACEGLAWMHKKRGEELVEADCLKEANEAFLLALSLTEKQEVKEDLNRLMKEEKKEILPLENTVPEERDQALSRHDEFFEDEQDVFAALCHTMTEEEQNAYLGYGDAFVKGFVALNNGDFVSASRNLSLALEENTPNTGYIPLELATCYMNMGDNDNAETLLNTFLKAHPDSFKGIQLLSELMWAGKNFQAVDDLLASCPDKISDTIFICLLKGENLLQAEKTDQAVNFCLECLEKKGRDPSLVEFLAKAYTRSREHKKALELYRELINTCFARGVLPGFDLKRQFAESSVRAMDVTADLLEIYFSLLDQDPGSRAHYFKRISQIHDLLGNTDEAEKFRSLAAEY
ncbi:MAG: tetratricopeptide repeat protein [Thermodesulfobacteriota bacterium]|nr:tetratricopeptide repeat protein [Thermodesulfobacteriota bacterium]